jgi:hypothetical protein
MNNFYVYTYLRPNLFPYYIGKEHKLNSKHCIHCDRDIHPGPYAQHHGDKCKFRGTT